MTLKRLIVSLFALKYTDPLKYNGALKLPVMYVPLGNSFTTDCTIWLSLLALYRPILSRSTK